MRFLIVHHICGGGGVTEAFFACLRMLRRAGHYTISAVPNAFPFLVEAERHSDEVMAIPLLSNSAPLFRLASGLWISTLASNRNVDRIVVNNGRFVKILKRLQRKPVIAIYHGGKVHRLVTADRIITVNNDLHAELLNAGYRFDTVKVIDNILPFDDLPTWTAPNIQPRLKIGVMALLEHVKGVDLLLEAAQILDRANIKIEVLIGGEGSERPMLESLVKSFGLSGIVKFLGWVEDRQAFYRNIDLLIVPSRGEGWGIVIVEAQSHGVPVIATNCAGPMRIIRDGDNGILIPRNDPEAIASAVKDLVQDQQKMIKLSLNGHASVRRYLIQNIEPEFVKFLIGSSNSTT